jgi:DNA mismatch repair ATPase MutS
MTSKTRKTTIRLLMIPTRMTKKCRSLKMMAKKKGRTKKKSMATMFHSTETPMLWRMLKRKERVSLIKKMRI